MIIVEKVLGNIKKQAEWQDRAKNLTPDMLEMSLWEGQKSRCRKFTQGGIELGLVLPRDQTLNDGDVLLWNEAKQEMIVVQMNLLDVMVIDLGLMKADISVELKTSFVLGHALGNQHWKAMIKDNRVLIPLTVSRNMVEAVLHSHGFNKLHYSCIPGETLLADLTPAEARQLFAGAENGAHHIHVEPTTFHATQHS